MHNSSPSKVFIAGIGTGVGKTVVSAALRHKWQAAYWKPIQSGDLHNSDTIWVDSMTPDITAPILTERYRLTQPLSPHQAAQIDGVSINLNDFKVPHIDGPLIVEGAGGIMAPLSLELTQLHLITHLDLPVVIVSRHYLGSINHSLLTISALRQQAIPILGIVFIGDNPATEEAILSLSKVPSLGKLPELSRGIVPSDMPHFASLIHI